MKRMSYEEMGFVKVKRNSTDPSWSPENPGDFFKGDWAWIFHPTPKLQEEHQEDSELAVS